MTPLILAALAAPPQATVPITTIQPVEAAGDRVAQVMAHYRAVTESGPQRCTGVAATTDILVCGARRMDRLPVEHEYANEALHDGSGRAALATSGAGARPCPPTGCTGVNLFAVPVKLFQIGKALITGNR